MATARGPSSARHAPRPAPRQHSGAAPDRLYIPLAAAREAAGDAGQRAAELVGAAARRHGFAAEIHRVRSKDLRNRRVLAALRARGIDRLPALLAGGRAHVGLRAIQAYYTSAGPAARGPPGGAQPPGEPDPLEEDGAEAALDAYFQREMQAGRRGGELSQELGPDLGPERRA